MIVILLGPPGVGKGTQAVNLADELGWLHLSTGDLLRAHRREGTPLGEKAQAFMDAGELVPDDIILGMVRSRLEVLEEGRGVVFDGFPRTVPQAEGLDGLLDDVGRSLDRVVVLRADDDVLVKRLSGRRSCPECGATLVHRKDDDQETVRNRLEVYREQTEPLIRFYEEHRVPVDAVDGAQPVEDVSRDLRAAVGRPGGGGNES